jgi:hypothetical protein
MKWNHPFFRAAILVAALTNISILTLRADRAPGAVLPDAVVDLRTTEGVVLTRNAQPAAKFQIAVVGINGPGSTHPDTYIWVRSATLDFYSPDKLSKSREVKLQVDKKDVALDAIMPLICLQVRGGRGISRKISSRNLLQGFENKSRKASLPGKWVGAASSRTGSGRYWPIANTTVPRRARATIAEPAKTTKVALGLRLPYILHTGSMLACASYRAILVL